MIPVVFDLEGDYKQEFVDKTSALIELDIENREHRIEMIDNLCESYTAATGKTPDPYQLTLLGNYVLKEELTDNDPNKSRKSEYCFLSEDQLERRGNREVNLTLLEFSIDSEGKRRGNETRIQR